LTCRHLHGTNGSQPRMPRRPSLPPPRSTGLERSLARAVACAHVAIPVVDRVNASVDEAPDHSDDALVLPSQLPTVELLRQPLDFTEYLPIVYTERLAAEHAVTSVGSRGDIYDKCPGRVGDRHLQERADLHRGPWRTTEAVELATLAGSTGGTPRAFTQRSATSLRPSSRLLTTLSTS
jgi:hypothetical protein